VTELISVNVTTYNREDALDAVLRSLACQIDQSFEVVVADDGSGPATAEPSTSIVSGTKIVGFSRRKSATARSWRRAASTASSSTATASCGRISSACIAAWPNRAASSPATSFCFRLN
jgi:hypothetical protein